MSDQDTGSASLREALIEWLGAASVVLRDRDVPKMREMVFTTESGMTSGGEVIRPDFYALALQNSEALSNLPEIDAVGEVARADPQIGGVLLADMSGMRRQEES